MSNRQLPGAELRGWLVLLPLGLDELTAMMMPATATTRSLAAYWQPVQRRPGSTAPARAAAVTAAAGSFAAAVAAMHAQQRAATPGRQAAVSLVQSPQQQQRSPPPPPVPLLSVSSNSEDEDGMPQQQRQQQQELLPISTPLPLPASPEAATTPERGSPAAGVSIPHAAAAAPSPARPSPSPARPHWRPAGRSMTPASPSSAASAAAAGQSPYRVRRPLEGLARGGQQPTQPSFPFLPCTKAPSRTSNGRPSPRVVDDGPSTSSGHRPALPDTPSSGLKRGRPSGTAATPLMEIQRRYGASGR